jgi:MFS family permease
VPLLALAFLDELWSGVPVVQAPAIEREHGLTHGLTALVLLTMPQIAGAIVEARVLLWAQHGHARRYAVSGLVALGLAASMAALAPSAWVLGLALAIAGPASGVACALAEGALMDAEPHARERQMTRWTLAGALGDLCAPLVVAIVGVFGLGLSAALFVVAGLVLAHAVVLARSNLSLAVPDDDEDDPGPRSLREAIRDRTLLLWLVGTTACALLDEILVALAALHLRRDFLASEAATATALGAWALGAGVGLVATERILRRVPPRRVILAAAVVCACTCPAWLVIDDPLEATIGLFVLGIAGAPLYPIATAQAYAACPGRAALVGAAAELFTPVEIALPWLCGALADVAGLPIALVALAAQPIVLFTLAWLAWPRPRQPASSR